MARAKHVYGGHKLDGQRLLRRVIAASAQPSEEMMLAERVWAGAEEGPREVVGPGESAPRVKDLLREGIDEYGVGEDAAAKLDQDRKSVV